MKFKCPQCKTAYALPAEVLPKPGEKSSANKLKCVRCKSVFLITAGLVESNVPSVSGDGVYFDMVSPDALPGIDFGPDIHSTDAQRVKYELHKVTENDTTGPVVSEASSWNVGSTLDLSDYEIGAFQRAANWKARTTGTLAFVLVGCILYVAAMNDWTISVNDWENDFKRAFFLQTEAEKETDLLFQMTVTLEKGYTIRLKKGKTVGVIRGEIQNNSSAHVDNVLLEGRILDAAKKTVSTVVVPCGIDIPDRKLRGLSRKQLLNLYRKRGTLQNCEIPSGYSKKFKVVFHELPTRFSSTHVFEVHPKAVSPRFTP